MSSLNEFRSAHLVMLVFSFQDVTVESLVWIWRTEQQQRVCVERLEEITMVGEQVRIVSGEEHEPLYLLSLVMAWFAT